MRFFTSHETERIPLYISISPRYSEAAIDNNRFNASCWECAADVDCKDTLDFRVARGVLPADFWNTLGAHAYPEDRPARCETVTRELPD